MVNSSSKLKLTGRSTKTSSNARRSQPAPGRSTKNSSKAKRSPPVGKKRKIFNKGGAGGGGGGAEVAGAKMADVKRAALHMLKVQRGQEAVRRRRWKRGDSGRRTKTTGCSMPLSRKPGGSAGESTWVPCPRLFAGSKRWRAATSSGTRSKTPGGVPAKGSVGSRDVKRKLIDSFHSHV
jgi:hypothetical protein